MFLFSVFYNIVLCVLSIILFPFILVAFLIKPKFRAGFFEKLGLYKFKTNNKYTIAFHAVSVGEVNAVENLVKRTRQEFPEANIVLTTTTRTGQEIANKKLKNVVDIVTYFPYDFAFSVNSFLNKVQPDVILIAETEIWPDFVYFANKKNIPTYIVNGRISPHSYSGYKKFSFFFKHVLNLYTGILMQTDGDAKRIIDIGADAKKVKVMGNLKFDIEPVINQQQITKLGDELGLFGRKLIIAASTHKGEDEIVLSAYEKVKEEFPDTKLMLVPRHPERYSQVETLLDESPFLYGKRSGHNTFAENDILMLDTMGELMKMFSVCHFAFIGGSFSNTGGHNPLEANIWKKPVLSGPCVFNFKDIYNFLTQSNAAKIVNSEEELAKEMKKLICDCEYYNLAADDAEKVFETNRGAIDRVIYTIKNK